MMSSSVVKTSTAFFNSLSLDQSVKVIEALAVADSFSYVVTPNVDHIQRLSSEPVDVELLSIYQNAKLSLCDSRILGGMLALKGKRVKETIPGSTLTQYLFESVLTKKDKILVVGVEDFYINRLRAMYPQLSISHINPSMGFIDKPDEVESIIRKVKEIDANYVFISVGSPRQEVLADKILKAQIVGGVGLCVGASILFLVGAEKRAPVFLQYLYLEWAFRLLQNPKRLAHRYFRDFISLFSIFKSL